MYPAGVVVVAGVVGTTYVVTKKVTKIVKNTSPKVKALAAGTAIGISLLVALMATGSRKPVC